MADKTPIHYIEILRKLKNSSLDGSPSINRTTLKLDNLPTLEKRIEHIFKIVKQTNTTPGNMLFFVMYDIESNKVRYNIVKYLERMGCYRVQKSIFLADLSIEKYESIKNDLAEVQSLYENNDSILVCPVSSDLIKSMKIIGKNINLDIITHTKNTLFF
jgi:CRISPR-associated protein Cas2